MANENDGRVWLPLAEAAARLGRSSDAVRSMIRRGKLSSRKGNDGGLLVGVPPADDKMSNGRVTGIDQANNGHAMADDRADDDRRPGEERPSTAELHADLTALREANAGLRAALARAEAERDAARAIREAEAAALNTLVAELRAELARYRLPWWRRVFGGRS